jgi:lysophospholipase L1-like esterase
MLGYDNYRIHLANILEILKKNKIHFTSAGLFDDKEALRINQELGIINIYDFSDILAGRDDIFLTKDRHWNAKGHRLIAEYLYQFLTIRQLL